MIERFKRLPNQLTLFRLLMAVPLWVFALLGLRTLLGIGLAVAGLTDVLDGPIARRVGRTSRFGSQMDSLADLTLFASIVIWLIMMRPEFFREYGTVIVVWGALGIVVLAVGWIRFRRLANLHLYSAKTAGVLGYLFALYMLMFDGPAAPFFWIAIGAAFLGSSETLVILLTRSNVDEHGGTILRLSRPARSR